MAGKSTKRSKRGKRARVYGHDFERLIANKLKEAFYPCDAFRTLQADKARDSDVTVSDAHHLVESIWWELVNAENPQPLKKLEQARDDVFEAHTLRVPVVVWRKKRARAIHVTLGLRSLAYLVGLQSLPIREDQPLVLRPFEDMPVQLDFDDFITMLRSYVLVQQAKERERRRKRDDPKG